MKSFHYILILLTCTALTTTLYVHSQELPPDFAEASSDMDLPPLPPLPEPDSEFPPFEPMPEEPYPGAEPYYPPEASPTDMPVEPYSPAEPGFAEPGFAEPAPDFPGAIPPPGAYQEYPSGVIPPVLDASPFEREQPGLQPIQTPKLYVPPKEPPEKQVNLKPNRKLSVKGNVKSRKELFKQAIEIYKTIQVTLNKIDDIVANAHEQFRQLDDKLDNFNTKTNTLLGKLDSILDNAKTYVKNRIIKENKKEEGLNENIQAYEKTLHALRTDIEKIASMKIQLIEQIQVTDNRRNEASKNEVEAGALKRKILTTPNDSDANVLFAKVETLSKEIMDTKIYIIKRNKDVTDQINQFSDQMNVINEKVKELEVQINELKEKITNIGTKEETEVSKDEQKVVSEIRKTFDKEKIAIDKTKDQLKWYEQVIVTTAHGVKGVHNILKLDQTEEMGKQTVVQVINTIWNSIVTLIKRPFIATTDYVKNLMTKASGKEKPKESVVIVTETEEIIEKTPEREEPEITQVDMTTPLPSESLPEPMLPEEPIPEEPLPEDEILPLLPGTSETLSPEIPEEALPPELRAAPEAQEFPVQPEIPAPMPSEAFPPMPSVDIPMATPIPGMPL